MLQSEWSANNNGDRRFAHPLGSSSGSSNAFAATSDSQQINPILEHSPFFYGGKNNVEVVEVDNHVTS